MTDREPEEEDEVYDVRSALSARLNMEEDLGKPNDPYRGRARISPPSGGRARISTPPSVGRKKDIFRSGVGSGEHLAREPLIVAAKGNAPVQIRVRGRSRPVSFNSSGPNKSSHYLVEAGERFHVDSAVDLVKVTTAGSDAKWTEESANVPPGGTFSRKVGEGIGFVHVPAGAEIRIDGTKNVQRARDSGNLAMVNAGEEFSVKNTTQTRMTTDLFTLV